MRLRVLGCHVRRLPCRCHRHKDIIERAIQKPVRSESETPRKNPDSATIVIGVRDGTRFHDPYVAAESRYPGASTASDLEGGRPFEFSEGPVTPCAPKISRLAEQAS